MAEQNPISWIPVDEGSPFPLTNLPFGVISLGGGQPRLAVAIGAYVIDLAALAWSGLLPGFDGSFAQRSLNPFLAQGPRAWESTRRRLTVLLSQPSRQKEVEPAVHPMAEVSLRMPFDVGDFVDFYSSLDHAANMGRMLRPDGPELPAAWWYQPIGYHGRAGSLVLSGMPVVRPSGPRGAEDFGPSQRLDFEAEVGFVVGVPSRRGHPLTPASLAEHVFGVVLVNDWSARDLQAWEYQPLGPFLGKSFATSISPWVVPLAALAAARVPPPPQDPPPFPYLVDTDPWSLGIELEVRLNDEVISRPPFRTTYWTPGQQLAHLTCNGAPLRTGDLLASGTVSGPEPQQQGSLMELAWNGTSPLTLPDGTTRAWLHDGDTVAISASAAGAGGTRIGWGEVRGTIHPALPLGHGAGPGRGLGGSPLTPGSGPGAHGS